MLEIKSVQLLKALGKKKYACQSRSENVTNSDLITRYVRQLLWDRVGILDVL